MIPCNTSIIAAWNDETGQDNQNARERSKYCVVVKCNKYDALLLSRIFYRYFAILTACHYDRQTLSMYCGSSGDPHELMDQLITNVKALQLEPLFVNW